MMGSLTLENFRLCFSYLLKWIYRIYDQNSDGSITKEDMSKLAMDMYGILNMDDPNIEAEALIIDTVYAE